MPLSEDVRQDLVHKIESANKLADRISYQSCWGYLHQVILDSRPEPRPYRELAEPWQWAIMQRICPAVESVAGLRRDYCGPRSFWFTLPRGHDKTSAIARLLNWSLAYARRRISGVAAAADREQAQLLTEFMEAEANLNPWLNARLSFKHNRVVGVNSGSTVKAISADAFSSFGLKSDLVICDELTHWPKRGLWDTLISGREKRPDAVFIVITNAGTLRSWQHDILKVALEDPRWFVYEAPHSIAKWMNADAIKALEKMLPPSVAKRVLRNKWIDAAEECGYVTRPELDHCELVSRDLNLVRRTSGTPEIRYVAALDYGPKRDRTVGTVCHQDNTSTAIIIDRMDVWQGSPEHPVAVATVEAWIDEIRRSFRRLKLVVDPYQMESTIQKYEGTLDIERFEPRGGKSNYAMAQCLRSLIANGKLLWYHGAGDIMANGKAHTFADELCELVVKPTAYGYRFDHTSGTHDDRAVATGMAALQLCQVAVKRPFVLKEGFF